MLSPVQTFLAQRATAYLKSELNIDANIGKVKIYFPNRIDLTDVYMADDHADTMIYAQHLSIKYGGFNTEKNQLNSQQVTLENGRFYLRKHQEDSLFNFAYFLEKLSSDTPVDTNAPSFKMKISNIDISDFRFTKHRLGCTDTCTNIFLTHAKIDLDNFYLNGDNISGKVNQIAFKDTTHFELFEFRGDVAYQRKYIGLRDFYIRTSKSELDGDVQLLYDSPRDLADFLSLVRIQGKFNPSTFDSDEFISYIPEFPKFDNFDFSGEIDGTVNDFQVENCIIDLGQRTRFFGNLKLKNPTEVDKLFITASIGEISTTPYEFKKYVGQFTGEMEWMSYLDDFRKIEYRGKYTGTVKDFDVDGWLKFDENEVIVDADMHDFDKLELATYKGTVIAKQLNLTGLSPDVNLGKTKFLANVEGKGLTAESVVADVNGVVDYIDIEGYRYQNLKLDGLLSERKFDGEAKLNDPNVEVDFVGIIDFNSDTIFADFKASMADANLRALGISPSEVAILNLDSDINFKLFSNTWWDGTMDVFNITYESPTRFYFFDTVSVLSNNSSGFHADKILSNLVSAELNGHYGLADVANAFISEYDDFNRFSKEEQEKPNVKFTYDVDLLNTDLLTELLLPELFVEPGSRLYGAYNGDTNDFSLVMESKYIRWKKLEFRDVNIDIKHIDTVQSITSKMSGLAYMKQEVDSISFESNFIKDSIWFATKGIYRDSIDSYFRLNGFAIDRSTPETEEYLINLVDGRFNIGDNYFDITEDNLIHILPEGEVQFENVGFYDNQSMIVLNGFRSKDPTKIMRIRALNLDAELINYVIRYPDLVFKGLMTGDIIISTEEDVPKFASDVYVDSLFVNNDFIGNTHISSQWNLETGIVDVKADITRKDLNMLAVTGQYFPDSSEAFNFNMHFDRFRLMWIDPFVDGILQDVRGVVNGDVHLFGNLDQIKTEGELTLNHAALGVPYFETDYSFQGSPKLKISTNRIDISQVEIRDTKEGTIGNLVGNVTHENFNEWAFDLKIDTKNLLVLNTENSPEAYFYGKAYAAGNVAIQGPVDDLSINVDITTNKGTNFKIPFSNPISVGAQDFITYTGKGSLETIIIDVDKIENQLKPIGGLDISINANITPDAQIELVMDETVGDIIKGRGTGNLRMSIPHDGDIEMYGTVEVATGDYLFTMRNIINKKFLIKQGGTITWNGDPYEATIRMKAQYTTRTTLTGFVTNNYNGERVQVDLIMDLDGPVTNPNINFDINLPNSNASWQEELDNRLSNPDKLNYQAFSLLLINSFWSDDIAETGFIEQGAGSNTMQMAAAQFSNWIAQGVGNYIDISVGYNTSTTQNYSDEVELDISKDFLDNRITVNSRIDVPVGASTDNTRTQSFTGDIEIIYKITPDGRIRAKAFNRNNQDNPALDKLSSYTQGVGVFYQTNFNTYAELFRKIFGIKQKEDAVPAEDSNAPETQTN